MRLFPLAILTLLITLFAFPPTTSAASQPTGDGVTHEGGLACFSITPPDTPTDRRGPHDTPRYQTCDQLCAAKHAACTATTSNFNPMVSCSDTYYSPGSTLCRCCASEH